MGSEIDQLLAPGLPSPEPGRPKEHTLQRPEEVGGTQQNSQRARDSHPPGKQAVDALRIEGPDQGERFGNKRRESAQSQGSEKGNHDKCRIMWHVSGQPPKVGNTPIGYSVVQ